MFARTIVERRPCLEWGWGLAGIIFFVSPVYDGMVKDFGVDLDNRNNVSANTDDYKTSCDKIWSAGEPAKPTWSIQRHRMGAIRGHILKACCRELSKATRAPGMTVAAVSRSSPMQNE